MKITVTQNKLSKALNLVSRVAVGKVTLPILNNVLIRVDEKKVSLITTNLDMAVVDFLPVSSSEDGVITVPAKLLAEFVSNLPHGENITIESTDNKVTISAGNYQSTINGSSPDDFPELPEIVEKDAVYYKMPIDEFKAALISVIIAASNDLTRPGLTGVYFTTDEEKHLVLVATDGYRLTKKTLPKKIDAEVKAIIPASSLQEVLRSITDDMDEIDLTFSEDLVRFQLGEVEIISKLLDGAYPDYHQLIPKSSEISVIVDRDELIRMTKLASLFSRVTNGSIICEAKKPDTFSVRSVANEYGENDSKIPAKIESDSEGQISLNARFLLDALNCFSSSKISFAFTSRMHPIVISSEKDPSYTHLVMPITG